MDLVLPGGASLFGSSDYLSSGNTAHPNPTEDDLLNALAAMERGDMEFVILQDEPDGMFMQTAGGPREGYVLEYNDGADETMFRAQAQLTGSQVVEAMSAFLNHNPAWQTMFRWERFTY
jgi:hypothetical protein